MFFSSESTEDRIMERVNMKSINKQEIQTASNNSKTSLLYLTTTPILIGKYSGYSYVKLVAAIFFFFFFFFFFFKKI